MDEHRPEKRPRLDGPDSIIDVEMTVANAAAEDVRAREEAGHTINEMLSNVEAPWFSIRHGTPVIIPEVRTLRTPCTIRVYGSLETFDAMDQLAILSHGDAHRIAVDTSCCSHFDIRPGQIFVSIGELEDVPREEGSDQTYRVLRARVFHSAEGFNIALFERVLKVRRAFLEKFDGAMASSRK
eukprot:TRINITY_DN2769_c0_g1_i3.p1 TRINITY_DN2769_c0_g1~~TRINITY_DN2769_c0_g1_i3.p1  ORF type:complete len:183 (-),score=47.30 TRINITY_DN2769_c0_g1_i3:1146-1694(-)